MTICRSACAAPVAACLAAWLLTRAVIWLAPRAGYLDRPSARKQHPAPMPLLGGIAVAAAFALGLRVSGMPLGTALPLPLVFLCAAGAMLLLGVSDDRHPLPPLPKFIGLSAAAALPAVLAWRGGMPFHQGIALAAALLFFSNAFNLLDNSDGQCASVSAAALCAAALHARHVTCLIAAAALLGFLWWNRPRARVFLGDAGSLLLGVWCVMLVLRADDAPGFTVNLKALPALWVPLYDTLSVIALRLWQGRPVWQGGQDHLAWRLMRRGMGPGRAALALAVASFVPAWAAAFLPGAAGLLITAGLLAGAALYETLAQRAPRPAPRTWLVAP